MKSPMIEALAAILGGIIVKLIEAHFAKRHSVNQRAAREAIRNGDTKALEEAIGSVHSGTLSGIGSLRKQESGREDVEGRGQ